MQASGGTCAFNILPFLFFYFEIENEKRRQLADLRVGRGK
jgi:hypothetical protein